jgi:hypothetical protein
VSRLLTRRTAGIAANIATAAFGAAIVLQLLLATGFLPSSMAWGGSQPVLPIPLRIASLIAALLLGLFAYIIRWRAGLLVQRPVSRLIKILSWVITLYMGLNALGNFASSSAAERIVFGPISLILAASCLLVSLSNKNG